MNDEPTQNDCCQVCGCDDRDGRKLVAVGEAHVCSVCAKVAADRLEGKSPSCSFCLRPHTDVRLLIQGPEVYICDECVRLCRGIIDGVDTAGHEPLGFALSSMYPRHLAQALARSIKGQLMVKKALSVAFYRHYQRVWNLRYPWRDRHTEVVCLDRSVVLLVGPKGAGKTLMPRLLAATARMSFVEVDAQKLVNEQDPKAGVSVVVSRLHDASNREPRRVARGVVCIADIDRLAVPKGHEVGLEARLLKRTQRELLCLMSSDAVEVKLKPRDHHPVALDISNVLFILCGHFPGLAQVVKSRLRTALPGSTFGGLPNAELLQRVRPVDLQNYGLLPELVSRLTSLISFRELTDETLASVRQTKAELLRKPGLLSRLFQKR